MGMTSTGEAIDYMMKEGFSESHGARPRDAKNHVIVNTIEDKSYRNFNKHHETSG